MAGRSRGGRVRGAPLVLVLAAAAAALARTGPRGVEAEAGASHRDSATSIAEADARVGACRSACTLVLLAWTPRMPLSRTAIGHVERAAAELDAGLVVVRSEDLRAYAEGSGEPLPAADAMLEAGALAHAPALVVFRDGVPAGPAVLGYKSAGAYERMIARRLSAGSGEAPPGPTGDAGLTEEAPSTVAAARSEAVGRVLIDYPVVGRPGAYFRRVPGRDAIAYESAGRVYLLDLADGESRLAPGYIDFVPTPDGRFFVTPGPSGRGGLRFYDADEVFEAARLGRSSDVRPIFIDEAMQDQYPSAGILEARGATTVYRVLTSWFDGLAHRDYEVTASDGTLPVRVRPLGEPVVPCQGTPLSTPILSPDGSEVAARDERTGTTKVFRILEGGRCTEVLDLGTATSKVAWSPSAERLAFAVPPRNRRAERGGGSAGAPVDAPGVYVYERAVRRATRVEGDREASLFAFPDLIGEDSLVFLVSLTDGAPSSAFRVVDVGR